MSKKIRTQSDQPEDEGRGNQSKVKDNGQSNGGSSEKSVKQPVSKEKIRKSELQKLETKQVSLLLKQQQNKKKEQSTKFEQKLEEKNNPKNKSAIKKGLKNTNQTENQKTAQIENQDKNAMSIKRIKLPEQEQINQEKGEIKSKGQVMDQSMANSTKTIRTQISITSRFNYKENLFIVFDHYCKMSYALRKAPTFDEIHEKAHIMTMNKFLIFCKDFNLRERVTREFLVQTFKDNATFCKIMNFGEFQLTLSELSAKIFQQYSDQKKFNKMLSFLKLHNSRAFTQRMNELGVMFRQRNKKQPKLISKYKYTLTPNNGKCSEQIALEVKEMKILRDQKKVEMMKWHKRHKTNKIDELYKIGAKQIGKDSRQLNLSTIRENHQISDRNVYNPSIILTTLNSPKKYSQRYQMKTLHPLHQYNHLGHRIKSSKNRQLKMNSIIKQAKDQIRFMQKQNMLTLKLDRIKNKDLLSGEQDISEMRIKSEIRTIQQEVLRKTHHIQNLQNHSIVKKNKRTNNEIINLSSLISNEEDQILNQHLKSEDMMTKSTITEYDKLLSLFRN